MLEAFYLRTSPWLVGAVTLVALAAGAEAGFRIGRRARGAAVPRRGTTATLGTVVLGLLGLLLAFSFSGAQARFDTRRHLVIDEADAIGTTYLRAQMLPEPYRQRTIELLARYVKTRTPPPDEAAIRRAIAESEELQTELWDQARAAARAPHDTATTLLFTDSLNRMIDLHTDRVAAYLFNAPPGLLFLLVVAAFLAVVVAGYGSGLEDDRNLLPTSVTILLLSLVMVVIVDLDEGQRGLIRVSQQALFDVRHQIEAGAAARAP